MTGKKGLLVLTAIIIGLVVWMPGCSKKHKSSRDSIPNYGGGGGGSAGGGTGSGGNGGGTSTGGGGTGGGSTGSGTQTGGGTGGGGGPAGKAGELFQLINEGRMNKGVDPLTWDPQIASVAEAYCRWLANWIGSKGSSSPYSPTADGKNPRQRLEEGGVTFVKCDETGVIGDPVYMPPEVATAQQAYANLDHSKLNNPAFTRAGVGHYFEHFGG
ncbi:MAG: CAP domain-containing protein [Planctomycetota bacterium]|nr:MAG: CAP domain-containing protein [Planctomycetota bacterium]